MRRSTEMLVCLLAVSFTFPLAAFGHGGDASAIHACVQQGSNQVRVVGPNDPCRGPETAVHWSIVGPQGPQGAPGPQGPQGPQGPAGAINYQFAQTNQALNLPNTFPWNDNVPQNTQGNELLAITITPKNATNLLVFDGTVNWSEPANHSNFMTIGIFLDGNPNALATATDSAHNSDGRCAFTSSSPHICTLPIRVTMQAGSTSQMTFRLRVGLDGGNVFVNQGFTGRRLGGTLYSTFSVTEIAQ